MRATETAKRQSLLGTIVEAAGINPPCAVCLTAAGSATHAAALRTALCFVPISRSVRVAL